MIEVFTDGRAEPNPGLGTYGYVVFEDGREAHSSMGVAGKEVSNNYAEYFCLVKALEHLKDRRAETVVVFSDSSLLVNQMEGRWKVKRGNYVEVYEEARDLANGFSDIEFVWIPREKNKRADELTNRAFYQARGW